MNDTNNNLANCARCPFEMSQRICKEDGGKYPPFCPTVKHEAVIDRCKEVYARPEVREFARQASIQEGEGYKDRELGYAHAKPAKPRIVEVIEFAHKMNYCRLGLGFCMGLRFEAATVAKILANNDFEVVSASCKIGRVPKEEIGIQEAEKVDPGCFESMCNPIAQAEVLNAEKTDFNLLLGLCVGHDSLFLKHTEAPCTVLAVKDRLMGHNPLAAIYTTPTYYRSLVN